MSQLLDTDSILKQIERSINEEFSRNIKKIIYKSIGVEIDTWGTVKNVDSELRNIVCSKQEIEKLTATITEELHLKLIKEIESEKFITKKLQTDIIQKIIYDCRNTIIEEVTKRIKDVVIQKSVDIIMNSDVVQSILIAKL